MPAEDAPLSVLAQQNDAFRRGVLELQGQRVHTRGIDCLGPACVAEIWRQVTAFDTFTADNDPHGEHDFGSIDHPLAGKLFWKIDYYDLQLQYGSEDPSDPSKTRRVLTVMLAGEY